MGAGFASALRSFLSSLVPRNHLSMLFTAIAVFDGIAFLGSGPLLQLCLSTGIKLGGVAVGLPFFVAATLYTVALGMVQLERVGR